MERCIHLDINDKCCLYRKNLCKDGNFICPYYKIEYSWHKTIPADIVQLIEAPPL